MSRQTQDKKGKLKSKNQKEKRGEEWWKHGETRENVDNTRKEGESRENIGKQGEITCKQGESGKNIEKQEKTRANQGKTQKNMLRGPAPKKRPMISS